LYAPNKLYEVENLQEDLLLNAHEDIRRVPSWRVDAGVGNVLPHHQNYQSEAEHAEQRNIEEENPILLEELVGVNEEDGGKF